MRSAARCVSRDARTLIGGDLHPLPVFVRGPSAMELAPGAGGGREQDLLRRRRSGEHRRDRRPQLIADARSLVDDQHRRAVVAQRQAAQHSRTIARQRHRQPARDQLDLSHRLAPEGGAGSDEVTGELAEQEAGLTQRRRDNHRKADLHHRPGGLERRYCALAALSRGVEQQARSGGEQHFALPGIERQRGDALRPSDGVIKRDELSRCQSRERVAEQGQLALEGGGAHASVACTRAMA